MTPREFVTVLSEARLPSVFNPWSDVCPVHDRHDAAARRRNNLEQMLAAALETKVETIWIARDLGYRGGRRTGVPLTDEVHLESAAALMGGIELERATEGPVVAERTAAVTWKVLSRIGQPVMLWNVFPFHPHDPDSPLSNRCHTRAERVATWPFLEALIEMLKPRQIIAIGRDAQMALTEFGLPTEGVRHPSYGGQREFIDSMFGLYGVSGEDEPKLPFENAYTATARSAFA